MEVEELGMADDLSALTTGLSEHGVEEGEDAFGLPPMPDMVITSRSLTHSLCAKCSFL